MDKQNVLAAVCFAVLSLVNLFVFITSLKYFFISAGVTKEDVKKRFGSQTVNRQRRMARWLRENAQNPKQFKRMFFICNALVAAFGVSLFMAEDTFFRGVSPLKLIAAICLTVLTAVLALSAFLCRRNIKESADNYSVGEKYTEHDDLSPEEHDALYESGELNFDGEEKLPNGREVLNNFIRRLIAVLLVLSLPTAGFFIMRHQQYDRGYGSSFSDRLESAFKEDDTEPADIDFCREWLQQNGFNPFDATENAVTEYPQFGITECMTVDEYETYFSYYSFADRESAESFQKEMQSWLEKTYSGGKETTKRKKHFHCYSVETDDGYAVSLCSENNTIVAHCDSLNSTWMKFALYELGYLEDF